MSQYQTLEVTAANGIVTIAVDRPDKLNALDASTIEELDQAFAEALADADVGGILVTGTGTKAFVAGADIAELARMAPVEGMELSRRGQRLFRRIELSRKPVVAAVNGFALGGGCELALACHLRVVASNASFGVPEVTLGIIPGYGATQRLPRLIGLGRALELLLTGEMISAEEAHRVGLANRVVEPERLLEESRALLERILSNGRLAVGFAIESAVRGLDGGMEEGLAMESNLFGLLAATDDMREGMTAFLEKRKPDFRGR